MENKTTIELTNDDAEMFLKWRKYQNKWFRLFNKNFVGSLTIHRAKLNPQIKFEWRTIESVDEIDNK